MGALAIPVEVSNRDLFSRLLLALEVLDRWNGLVIFGRKREVELGLRSPKLSGVSYVSKGIIRSHLDLYMHVNATGGSIFSLDEEGGVFSSDFQELLAEKYPRDLIESGVIRLSFMWGRNQLKLLDSEGSSMKVTGNPRFDLLDPKYCELYKIRADDKGLVSFFLSNTFINNSLGFEGLCKLERKNLGSLYDRAAMIRRREFEEKCWAELCGVIEEIVSSNPDIRFLLRPAPQENPSFYSMFDNYKNVVVDSNSSAASLLLKSRLVIHQGSTVGFEAAIAGIPSVCFLPKTFYESSNSLQKMVIDASPLCTSFADLKNLVEAKEFKNEVDLNLVSEWISNAIEKNASKLIANDIVACISSDGSAGFRFPFSNGASYCYSIVENIMGSYRNVEHKCPALKYGMIVKAAECIAHKNNLKQVSVRKLGDNIFTLQRR